MRPVSSSFGVVAVIICAKHVARAQYTTSAICSPSFDWASNQQGQSPCLVAAYVMGACSKTGVKEVYALPDLQTFYIAPYNPLTECGCSMANYNLLAACTACQDSLPPRFTYWMTNCTNAGIDYTSTYYPASKWPIPDGVQIPLWAQQDARLWTNVQFNSTEAQEIATSGKLIGPPLGSSSTTSATTGTISTSTAPTPAPIDSKANVGPIVGGVVGGVLGLLLIGVLIWWILRQRRPSYEGASPSLSAAPFEGSTQPTPALINMAVHDPHRPPHASYPSYVSYPPPTFHGTGNMECGYSSPRVMVQHAPGALDHNGALTSYHYATAGVGLPSNRMLQMGVLQSPTTNMGHQAHMTLPFNTDLGRMITATPDPMSPETPNPPSYMVSQVETKEEQLR